MKRFAYKGKEDKYVLNTDYNFVKANFTEGVPLSQATHNPVIEFTLFSTSMGKPVNEVLPLSVSSYYVLPPTLPIQQYKHENVEHIKEMF